MCARGTVRARGGLEVGLVVIVVAVPAVVGEARVVIVGEGVLSGLGDVVRRHAEVFVRRDGIAREVPGAVAADHGRQHPRQPHNHAQPRRIVVQAACFLRLTRACWEHSTPACTLFVLVRLPVLARRDAFVGVRGDRDERGKPQDLKMH